MILKNIINVQRIISESDEDSSIKENVEKLNEKTIKIMSKF